MNQCPQAQDVAIGTETTDLPNGNRSNVGMVTEGFATMDIAEVNLDGGKVYSGDRISKGNTRMSIGSRIDQDALSLPHCIVDGVHQNAFVVRL